MNLSEEYLHLNYVVNMRQKIAHVYIKKKIKDAQKICVSETLIVIQTTEKALSRIWWSINNTD